MKRIIFLLMACNTALSTIAQTTGSEKQYTTDKDMASWVLDVNLLGGAYRQKMNAAVTTPNYLNGVNVRTGNLSFSKGGAIGGDIQIGYFFKKQKHWGIGTGIMYLRESGNVLLNGYHAEYQSVDNNGYIFRQVVTANDIVEKIKIDNFNIPLVLKYKNRLSSRWGFTADAGLLFNLKTKTAYTTNAAFNYEAIYKFVTSDAGTITPVYDNAPVPDNADFLITKSQYQKNNPTGNVQDYFAAKRAAGYNVGLGVNPNQKGGTTAQTSGSIGFMLQPSVNYFFSDHVALNVGAYYLYQPFKNDGASTYTMTGKPGEYSSVMNSVSKTDAQSFGVNIGVRFFLGKKTEHMNIAFTNQSAPSGCGMCDGGFMLHGLKPGQKASVNYSFNGAQTPSTYAAVADNEGTVVVPDLCAGSYTNIIVLSGRAKANSQPVTLVAPKFEIGKVETTNPSAPGKCDGTISLYGLISGQTVVVNYMANGVKAKYTNTVFAGNAITITGLCQGKFTNISVTSKNCTAELTNPQFLTLTDKPLVIIREEEDNDSLKNVLFEFNQSVIRMSSYAIIDAAYEKLRSDKMAYLIIKGNTDKTGSDTYNQALSQRRADAVKDYLVNKGINSGRIRIQAKGEKDPVATNDTEEGRSKNRRAEMILMIN